MFTDAVYQCAASPFTVVENAGPAQLAITLSGCILTSPASLQVIDVAGGSATGVLS